MTLSPQLSVVLNWLRFLAAFIVVLGHSNKLAFGSLGEGIGKYGHTMVILFFVMSGFIVSRTTMDAKLDLCRYLILRSSRVLIVAIPALFFSWSASYFLVTLEAQSVYKDETLYSPGWIDILRNMFFLDHVWVLGRGVSLNPPYWSLTYEVWYYLLFAVMFFLRGLPRVWIGMGIVLLSGPALWVLMPTWFLGVLLCFVPRITYFETRGKLALLAVAVSVPIIIVEFGIDLVVQKWIASHVPFVWRLAFSTKFLTDFVIALAFFVSFLVLGSLNFKVAPSVVRLGSFLAGFSFTLYLFHEPMLRILSFCANGYMFSVAEHLLVIFFTVFLCWWISLFTERKTSLVRSYMERLSTSSLGNK